MKSKTLPFLQCDEVKSGLPKALSFVTSSTSPALSATGGDEIQNTVGGGCPKNDLPIIT